MSNAIHSAVIQACRSFMVPIARFLLRHGVSYKEFAEVAKWAFVHVASEDFGTKGRPASISRITEVTRISRRGVQRTRDEFGELTLDGIEQVSKAGHILSSWYQEAEYLDAFGKPRALPLEGEHGFGALTAQHAPGVSSDDILAELSTSGAVTFDRDAKLVVPESRYYVPSRSDPEIIKRFGLRIRDLAQTIYRNLISEDPSARCFEATAYSTKLEGKYYPLFHRVVADQGIAFLKHMDDWLSAHETTDTATHDKVLGVGVGVYLFEEIEGS